MDIENGRGIGMELNIGGKKLSAATLAKVCEGIGSDEDFVCVLLDDIHLRGFNNWTRKYPKSQLDDAAAYADEHGCFLVIVFRRGTVKAIETSPWSTPESVRSFAHGEDAKVVAEAIAELIEVRNEDSIRRIVKWRALGGDGELLAEVGPLDAERVFQAAELAGSNAGIEIVFEDGTVLGYDFSYIEKGPGQWQSKPVRKPQEFVVRPIDPKIAAALRRKCRGPQGRFVCTVFSLSNLAAPLDDFDVHPHSELARLLYLAEQTKRYMVKVFEDGISVQYVPYTDSAEQVRKAGASRGDVVGAAVAEIVAGAMDDEEEFNSHTEDWS
jgi:hypothetical protein